MGLITDEISRFNIEEELKKLMYHENAAVASLEWGMNHIMFAPSKRVRPLLVLEANQVYCEPDDDTYVLAAAVELIHTYSLVHDDLPCMDDDGLRRGVQTLHVLYGDAYGVLVGDALLTEGYSMLSRYNKPQKLPLLLKLFGEKAGRCGMVYGQMLDLEYERGLSGEKKMSLDAVNKVNRHKTGCLLQLSLLAGAINGGAESEDLEMFDKLGAAVGDVFQIKDDILDETSSTEVLGKPVGSDERNEKSSIVRFLGISGAEDLMNQRKNDALELIKDLPGNRDFFEKFLDFLVTREK
jgi:geranylgeranyl diphosphate synthase type II